MAESHSLLESYLESDLLGCTDQRGCLDLQRLEGFEPQKTSCVIASLGLCENRYSN